MQTQFKIIRFWLIANNVQLIYIIFLIYFIGQICRVIFNF